MSRVFDEFLFASSLTHVRLIVLKCDRVQKLDLCVCARGFWGFCCCLFVFVCLFGGFLFVLFVCLFVCFFGFFKI